MWATFLVKGWKICQVYKCMYHPCSTLVLKIEVTCHLSPLLGNLMKRPVHLMLCLLLPPPEPAPESVEQASPEEAAP